MDMSNSRTFKITSRTPIDIWVAPGAPTTMDNAESLNKKLGHIELNRDFPGAIDAALPGLGSNAAMQPLYIKPRPSVLTPDVLPKSGRASVWEGGCQNG